MVDGRELRWRGHNTARRLALLDGTIAAVRTFGCDIGINGLASANGVSAPVLYRHFSSKDELLQAAVAHYVETILTPRIRAAASSGQDDFQRTRAIIATYVDAVLSDGELHRFSLAHNLSGDVPAIATEAEHMIAESLGVVIEERLRASGKSPSGAQPLAFAMVGAIRSTVQWWVTSRTMTENSLVDYLSMMLFGGIAGIAESRGFPSCSSPRPKPDEQLVELPIVRPQASRTLLVAAAPALSISSDSTTW
ncbi:TetR/AcrR family transcriptional regulator [Rhodococcus sp. 1R11]|uniref:TetR/AcrR family transcriptional regulator n=1 Tax=Rhodococcus sp. 1R11 TaxID=2559614 RepID=UPI00142FF0AC|nr:TetR/AcrR family transcriptional regulator [Rhodococcus sp. 1R11]